MKISDGGNIEFSDSEQSCIDRYRENRDKGLSERESAEQALASMLPVNRSPEFIGYLSNGGLRLTPDKRVVRTGAHRASRPILGADEVAR